MVMVTVRTPGRWSFRFRTRVIGRLGPRVWTSVSFQIFALTAGGKCPKWGEKLSGGGMSGGDMTCPTLEAWILEHISPWQRPHPPKMYCMRAIVCGSSESLRTRVPSIRTRPFLQSLHLWLAARGNVYLRQSRAPAHWPCGCQHVLSLGVYGCVSREVKMVPRQSSSGCLRVSDGPLAKN